MSNAPGALGDKESVVAFLKQSVFREEGLASPISQHLTSLSAPSPELPPPSLSSDTSRKLKVSSKGDEGKKSTNKKMASHVTGDKSLDWRGNPAIKRTTGGWKSAKVLLVNYGLANFAFFGVAVNLVVFLRRVLHQDNAAAANSISKWTGTVYIFSLVGAFFSDSYLGRHRTCVIFQFIYVVGLTVLSITSWFLLVKPSECGDGDQQCERPSMVASSLFYFSIYLIALGHGGYQPSIATFGSDQFDETDPSEGRCKISFFTYFYFTLNAGSFLSNTILVYYEDSGKWVIGFWTSTAAAILGLMLFLAGTRNYRYFKTSGNPLTRIAQVLVVSFQKRKLQAPTDSDMLYESEEGDCMVPGSRKILHSDGLRFLDKAAVLTEADYQNPGNSKNKWKLCTVTQVEEAKCVLRMIPIWLCTIVYSIVFTQTASMFVEQGAMMSTRVSSFEIPPASMSAFDIVSVMAFIIIYRTVIMPAASSLTKNRKGFTQLQRMGIGLVIGMLAMVAAGLVELERLGSSIGDSPSSLTILWQAPQYALIGASEVFMYVGQLEFFSKEAPDGVKSFGSSLCMASISLGNYFSIALVSIINNLTSGERKPGWIPSNLNLGHLDRFYFLLAALSAIDFGVYLVFSMFYKEIKYKGNDDGQKKALMMVEKSDNALDKGTSGLIIG